MTDTRDLNDADESRAAPQSERSGALHAEREPELVLDNEGGRVKFQGIVEAGPEDHAAASADPSSFEAWAASGAAAGAAADLFGEGRDWPKMSRRVTAVSRLVAGFFVVGMIVVWPAGWIFAHRLATGSFAGIALDEIFTVWVMIFAILAPVLILFLGYIVSRVMTMMGAAEQIADAARQLIQPDRNAVFNVESVGAAVRTQVDAINTGIDDALIRLASVEAMIRDHVRVIEETGAAMENRTAGSLDKVATERARLIELTENLNFQADDFASAIAERAQASIESLSSADNLTAEAEHRLEERLSKLEGAARRALQSFDALGEALADADSHMRRTASSIEASSDETRKASKTARAVADEAAESAARNAANIGLFAGRAAEEAKAAAEKSIAASREETARAAEEVVKRTAAEASRITDAANTALEKVVAATDKAVDAASSQATRAIDAANKVSQAAEKAAEAAQTATTDVTNASENASKAADEAAAQSEATAKRVEARNEDLAKARAALEAENARLETLIDEQRQRADRLAEAIATQTERLSKLAENQLREQEAAARLAEAQAAIQARSDQDHSDGVDEPTASNTSRGANPGVNGPIAEGEAVAPKPSPAPTPTSSKTPKSNTSARRGAAKRRDDGEPKVSGAKTDRAALNERLDTLADAIAQPASGKKTDAESRNTKKKRTEEPQRADPRRKERASWKEILSATDRAKPLDLNGDKAPPSGQQPSNDMPPEEAEIERAALDAMRVVNRLQNFTLNLERRLYGEPPPALLERFDTGDRNVFAHRLLRLNESDVKRRIRMESGRDKKFERAIHEFLQGFEALLEDATTSETADEELEEYLSSPLGRVYLLIGATVGYFA